MSDLRITALGGLLALAACGVDRGTGDDLEQVETSNEIDSFTLADGAVVTFSEEETSEDGPTEVSVSVTTRDDAYPHIEELFEAGATALEIYNAVSDGKPAPQVLVDSHPREAAAAGRTDMEPREYHVDASVRPRGGYLSGWCTDYSTFRGYMNNSTYYQYVGTERGQDQATYSPTNATRSWATVCHRKENQGGTVTASFCGRGAIFGIPIWSCSTGVTLTDSYRTSKYWSDHTTQRAVLGEGDEAMVGIRSRVATPPSGSCNPLSQNCAAGDACRPDINGNAFACSWDAAAVGQTAGGWCDHFDECAAGMLCVNSFAYPGCGHSGCCTPFCDVDLGNGQCPAGTECVDWYGPGEAPLGLEDVGICVAP